MKKLFIGIALSLAIITTAFSQESKVVTTTGTTATASDLVGFLLINSITFVNDSATTPNTVELWDSPTTASTYSSPGWTNTYGYYDASVTKTVLLTNFFTGFVQTNSYAARYLTNVAVAAATSNYAGVVKFTIPAGSSTTWTPVKGRVVNFGIYRTNDMPTTIIYDYLRYR